MEKLKEKKSEQEPAIDSPKSLPDLFRNIFEKIGNFLFSGILGLNFFFSKFPKAQDQQIPYLT